MQAPVLFIVFKFLMRSLYNFYTTGSKMIAKFLDSGTDLHRPILTFLICAYSYMNNVRMHRYYSLQLLFQANFIF